jgi:hypothetical protein
VHGALVGRGLDHLSPPEVESVLLELPAERAAYRGLVSEIAGWPDRSPIGRRVPNDAEVEKLLKTSGRWRAVTLLEDEQALRIAATVFARTFVLDPLYDTGDLLYAAWHDPTVNPEHARRLAEQAALLVRAGPLLRDGRAVLAPDHLPGSWDPRPGWRRPRADATDAQLRAWALRTGLVLVHWANQLDAVVCVARPDVVEALNTVLLHHAASCALRFGGASLEQALTTRKSAQPEQNALWSAARKHARRRSAHGLADLGCALERIAPGDDQAFQLVLGETNLPDPALLLRRVLNDTEPHRHPALPKVPLKRRTLFLLG